ncbi:MAG: hypothetical protein M3279_12815 [Actinomycetota bacterium]|nr:hypothetical protein [Actinomycetota bacterium]
MRRTAVALLAPALLLALFVGTAVAHPASDYYWLHEWKSSHHTGLNITWRFGPGFPNDAKRDRVKESFAKWNNQGQQMKFEKLPEADFSYDLPCPEPQGYNGVLWRDLAQGVAAEVRKCDHDGGGYSQPYPIHNFWVAFNNDGSVNWHGGADATAIGNNELDFEGVATHEIGHATAWSGHFREVTWPNCENPDIQPTMCPGYTFGLGRNSTYARSLEDHEAYVRQ